MRLPLLFAWLTVAALLASAAGCQWVDQWRGDGFSSWNSSLGGLRQESSQAKPSGYFFDRRSDEIERSLGGGF